MILSSALSNADWAVAAALTSPILSHPSTSIGPLYSMNEFHHCLRYNFSSLRLRYNFPAAPPVRPCGTLASMRSFLVMRRHGLDCRAARCQYYDVIALGTCVADSTSSLESPCCH